MAKMFTNVYHFKFHCLVWCACCGSMVPVTRPDVPNWPVQWCTVDICLQWPHGPINTIIVYWHA